MDVLTRVIRELFPTTQLVSSERVGAREQQGRTRSSSSTQSVSPPSSSSPTPPTSSGPTDSAPSATSLTSSVARVIGVVSSFLRSHARGLAGVLLAALLLVALRLYVRAVQRALAKKGNLYRSCTAGGQDSSSTGNESPRSIQRLVGGRPLPHGMSILSTSTYVVVEGDERGADGDSPVPDALSLARCLPEGCSETMARDERGRLVLLQRNGNYIEVWDADKLLDQDSAASPTFGDPAEHCEVLLGHFYSQVSGEGEWTSNRSTDKREDEATLS